MDKGILKKFAIESRQDLMNKISNKINTFYLEEEFKKVRKGEVYLLSNENNSLSLTKEVNDKRDLLIKRKRELTLELVIEEAAYTWFNRIIAIRYMEINDMLPLTKNNSSLGIRVLSSKDNTPDPEILKFTNLTNSDLDINFKKEKYTELKDDNEKFKYVLLLICKKLGKVIPQVFGGTTDYIDILIPDNLLNDAGFITKIINDVPEENYSQVEIIGWLYQYYNQAEKDRVISAKKAYKKNEIPYATQLFTPDWIVKYM
ncbi:MAG: SAM-dependent methyltransferase, partial [Clostridia bacterium]